MCGICYSHQVVFVNIYTIVFFTVTFKEIITSVISHYRVVQFNDTNCAHGKQFLILQIKINIQTETGFVIDLLYISKLRYFFLFLRVNLQTTYVIFLLHDDKKGYHNH